MTTPTTPAAQIDAALLTAIARVTTVARSARSAMSRETLAGDVFMPSSDAILLAAVDLVRLEIECEQQRERVPGRRAATITPQSVSELGSR